jgi:hypothetical protein
MIQCSFVDGQDAEQIEAVVCFALANAEGRDFVELLLGVFDTIGWEATDPLTIWTIAMYADRFPMRLDENEGTVVFVTPETALHFSQTPLFRNEPHLVDLAQRRVAMPNRRKALDGEPYLGS